MANRQHLNGMKKMENVNVLMKENTAEGYPNTISSSRNDCEKVKIEQVQERTRRRELGQTELSNPIYRDQPPPAKKEKLSDDPVLEPYAPPTYCPCIVFNGHFDHETVVAYCCVRKDCDEATKIGEDMPPSRSTAASFFKF